jgi:hypothetical protein
MRRKAGLTFAPFEYWRAVYGGDTIHAITKLLERYDPQSGLIKCVKAGLEMWTYERAVILFSSLFDKNVVTIAKFKGFDVEVDGRLGPKTHDALISFQRKSGLQASGKIDTQTATKLGVNIAARRVVVGSPQPARVAARNMPSREQGQQGRRTSRVAIATTSGATRTVATATRRQTNTEGRSDQRSEQDRNNNANAPSTTGQGGQQRWSNFHDETRNRHNTDFLVRN